MMAKAKAPKIPVSRQSRIGLNTVNFFLAEMAGVIIPFLSTYLRGYGWAYGDIGVITAIGGVGTLLMQIPSGILSDKTPRRRLLLGSTSLILGVSYALLPLSVGSMLSISALMFISGAADSFFVPLLATLALSLVGYKYFDRMIGINQSWNHAGNIAAAVLALVLVQIAGIVSIFYVMGLVSCLAATSLLLIRSTELNPDLAREKGEGVAEEKDVRHILSHVRELLRERSVRMLVIAAAIWQIANTPIMPLVGLYLKKLTGNNAEVALVVVVAQIVMIPVALLAGRFAGSLGRKPIFAIAFLVLPVRIFLYSITRNPTIILALQTLDGVGAGIYGVVIALMCGDLTRGKSGFNTLLSIMQAALALGAVLGPLAQGFLTEELGFAATFIGFACLAGLGAVVFLLGVPETKNYHSGEIDGEHSLAD